MENTKVSTLGDVLENFVTFKHRYMTVGNIVFLILDTIFGMKMGEKVGR